MAIVTAYDRLGTGLNKIDTDSAFVPSGNRTPSGQGEHLGMAGWH